MKRGFYWSSKAWWDRGYRDITFGVFDGDGCTGGEMRIEWTSFGPQLQVFSDGWAVLATFGDLLEKMAKVADPTEEDFVKILLECGFEDLTPYSRDVAEKEWHEPSR